MRLSSFVVAFLVFLFAILISLHTLRVSAAAFGASSSSTHSSGGFSSSGSSSHSSSSSPSHASGTSSSTPHGSTSSKLSSPAKASSTNESESEKRGRSFFHPFRKREPFQKAAFARLPHCWKGECTVCPPGSRSRGGACFAGNSCLSGQAWNGFSCGVLYERFWSNNCRDLAAELEAQRARMRAFPGDPGEALRYQRLLEQYQRCLQRSSVVSYVPFSDTLLYDIP